MKIKLHVTLLLLFTFLTVNAQTFQGDWYGKLDVGVKLPLILHVQQIKKNKYDCQIDSPSQKSFGLKAAVVKVKKDSIFMEFKSLSATYRAKAVEGGLNGTFTQFGASYPLNLVPDSAAIAPPKRLQQVKAPFPYNVEEVTFKNEKDNVTLSGTLTYPKVGTSFKTVILVTGSGPQDRNEEMLDHKPFLVIADYLTRNGIAVLRYDDRGVGKSTGSFSKSTIYDFKRDASSAIAYLRTRSFVNQKYVGIIGHSEGGMIAEMLAAEEPRIVNFAIFLAAPAVPLDSLMVQQNRDVLASSKMTEEEIDTYIQGMEVLYKRLKIDDNCNQACLLELMKENFADYDKNPMQYLGMATQLSSDWFREFLRFEPATYLEKITVPVLALNGNKDVQVKGEPNLKAISIGLDKAGNNNYQTILYPNMNHLFQPCETGAVSEYQDIEITFSEKALKDITNWILIVGE